MNSTSREKKHKNAKNNRKIAITKRKQRKRARVAEARDRRGTPKADKGKTNNRETKEKSQARPTWEALTNAKRRGNGDKKAKKERIKKA